MSILPIMVRFTSMNPNQHKKCYALKYEKMLLTNSGTTFREFGNNLLLDGESNERASVIVAEHMPPGPNAFVGIQVHKAQFLTVTRCNEDDTPDSVAFTGSTPKVDLAAHIEYMSKYTTFVQEKVLMGQNIWNICLEAADKGLDGPDSMLYVTFFPRLLGKLTRDKLGGRFKIMRYSDFPDDASLDSRVGEFAAALDIVQAEAAGDLDGPPALGEHGGPPALGKHGGQPALVEDGGPPALGKHGGQPALVEDGGPPALGKHGGQPALVEDGGPPALGKHGGQPALVEDGGPPALGEHGGQPALVEDGGPPALGEDEEYVSPSAKTVPTGNLSRLLASKESAKPAGSVKKGGGSKAKLSKVIAYTHPRINDIVILHDGTVGKSLGNHRLIENFASKYSGSNKEKSECTEAIFHILHTTMANGLAGRILKRVSSDDKTADNLGRFEYEVHEAVAGETDPADAKKKKDAAKLVLQKALKAERMCQGLGNTLTIRK